MYSLQKSNPLREKILYKMHSGGKVGTWRIVVESKPDQSATMGVYSAKVIGGLEVETITYIEEGKNVGKANETTPWMQANNEMQSKINKKLDSGYVETLPTSEAKVRNTLGFELPMLAMPIGKCKPVYPIMVQPKLDGHRMLAASKDGKVILYSRQGKPLYLPELEEQLKHALDVGIWDGVTLDGEVYAHGMTLQTISSYVKKYQFDHETNLGTRSLNYCMYDRIDPSMQFEDRYKELDKLEGFLAIKYPQTDTFGACVLTPTTVVRDHVDYDIAHERHTSSQFEGSIARDPKSYYEEGKRSKGLMKRKDEIDNEFEIIGVTTGKPNVRLKTLVGIYKCITTDGKEFEVLAPGDAQEKHEHALHGENNIGKMLTVFFFSYTPEGAPFHITKSRIREDI